MAEKRNKLIHIHSSVDGKLPTGLTEPFLRGEIAVNDNPENPFLSIKTGSGDTENDYVTFSADKTIFDVIEKNEKVTAAAITGLSDEVSEIKETQKDFIKNGDIQILEFANTEDTPSIINFGKLITTEDAQFTTSGIGGNEDAVSIMSFGVDEETNLVNAISQGSYSSEIIQQTCGT